MREIKAEMAAEGSPYRRHVPALDGLRGVAVVGVMLSHLFVMRAATAPGQLLQQVLGFGGVGVVLFFVLSGFLITGILVDSLEDDGYFRKFYLRRVLRIFPLYYGVLLVFAGTVWFGRANYAGELRSLALYLQNTNLLGPAIWYYAGPSKLPLMHFWTLAVEEQFYLVWPLAVFMLRERREALWACVGGSVFSIVLRFVLAMHGSVDADVHGMTACRLDTLLLGGALAMLVRSRWHDRTLRLGGWMLGAGVLLAVLCGEVTRVDHAPRLLVLMAFTLAYFAYALACAGLLVVALGPAKVWFSVGWLRWMGRYSYGLYVFHYMFNGLWAGGMRRWMLAHATASPALAVTLAGCGIAALSIAAAVVSFELYEKQFLRLKRLVPYSRREASVASIA
jgi:peptidoglycan/LPS O-acetylase OafA/YrhL